MKSAYKTSGKIFEQVSMRAQPKMLEQLHALTDKDIVVVQGTYDHIEKLLDTISVPYTLIQSDGVKSHNGGRVMFANCMDYSNGAPVKAVSSFVEEGGRLVTTDWALGLVQKAFPGKVNRTQVTSDDVVEIECHTDIARRFIGLNYAQCHPKWWLEGSSHIYDIGNGVTPIITSEEMEAKYGKPYVAVGFAAGKGEVFHFISHLELQRTRLQKKEGKTSLDDFLKKVGAEKTSDMEDATFAELEAAYSTLNTLANLCIPAPILSTDMKSTYAGKSIGSLKSKSLL